MLWCLKALAFKTTDDVVGSFAKIESFYKRFCSMYEKMTTHFNDLFVSKLNLDYWNTVYMVD
jgi:hypothetical protein